MKIAVVIPAWNAAAFLAEAVESALAQTHAAAAVVVVDDGSTDATAAVAERFATRVTVLRQDNAGVATARNRGAAAAPDADWLLFLDADDRLRPGALAALSARALERPSARLIYGQAVTFPTAADKKPLLGAAVSEGPAPTGCRANFWKSVLPTPGVALLARSLFQEAGEFCPRYDTLADRDLWIKCGALAEFAFAAAPVLERRLHADSMCQDRAHARQQAVTVQLGFLAWSAERGLSLDFLHTSPLEILTRNLDRALDERAWSAAGFILAEARRRQILLPGQSWKAGILAVPPAVRGWMLRSGKAISAASWPTHFSR